MPHSSACVGNRQTSEIRKRRLRDGIAFHRTAGVSKALARRPTGASLRRARVPGQPTKRRHHRFLTYPTLVRLPPDSGALAKRPTGAFLTRVLMSDTSQQCTFADVRLILPEPGYRQTQARFAGRPTGASLRRARPSDPMRAGRWRARPGRPGIRPAGAPSARPPHTRIR